MADGRDRVIKYINGVRKRLGDITGKTRLIELAEQYTNDAEYYLNRGDVETALVDVVYAEGILDAYELYLGGDPKGSVSSRVFVGGTFDIIHPGHIEFLKFASTIGRVYVAVARDVNVMKFKGRLPVNDENHRLEVVRSIRYVFEAFLGDENDLLKSVERVRPSHIVLGPDQKIDEGKLLEELKQRGMEVEIIRVPGRYSTWKHSSSSSIIKEIIERASRGELKV